jgi:hypothetical protein
MKANHTRELHDAREDRATVMLVTIMTAYILCMVFFMIQLVLLLIYGQTFVVNVIFPLLEISQLSATAVFFINFMSLMSLSHPFQDEFQIMLFPKCLW